MVTVKYPNDVPWLPGYAVLGTTEAILIDPIKLGDNARDLAEKKYALRLRLASHVACKAIDKMMGVSEDEK